MSAKRTMIYSIFGGAGEQAAEIMIKRHGLERIDPSEFPKGAPKVNDMGRPALFAIVVPGWLIKEFDDLIELLRA